MPCGGAWPDVKAFYLECIACGYNPLIVVIARDESIVRSSSIARGRPDPDVRGKIKRISEDVQGTRFRLISYESLVSWGKTYFDQWVEPEGPEMIVDESWFSFVRDENRKHFQPGA